MPNLLMRRVCMPQSLCARECFERIIFAGENRYSDQQALLGDPAYCTFSDDCSWDPSLRVPLPEREPVPDPGAIKRWQPRTPALAAGLTNRVWSW
jgi:hypothetical protein